MFDRSIKTLHVESQATPPTFIVGKKLLMLQSIGVTLVGLVVIHCRVVLLEDLEIMLHLRFEASYDREKHVISLETIVLHDLPTIKLCLRQTTS